MLLWFVGGAWFKAARPMGSSAVETGGPWSPGSQLPGLFRAWPLDRVLPGLSLRGRLGGPDVSSQWPTLLREQVLGLPWQGWVLKVAEVVVQSVENHPETAAHTPCLQSSPCACSSGNQVHNQGKLPGSDFHPPDSEEGPHTLHQFTAPLHRLLHGAHLSTDTFLLLRTQSFSTKEVPKYYMHSFSMSPQGWHSGWVPRRSWPY